VAVSVTCYHRGASDDDCSDGAVNTAGPGNDAVVTCPGGGAVVTATCPSGAPVVNASCSSGDARGDKICWSGVDDNAGTKDTACSGIGARAS
jgi:hypothetical protein